MAERGSFAERARQIAAAHPDIADPRDLAPFMLEEIRGEEQDLLLRLLPTYIRSVLSRRGDAGSEEEAWGAFLDERLATETRGTIFVREAVVTEIDAAATRRERFSGNLDRRAQQYRQVAEAMREHEAHTASDLTVTVGITTLAVLEARLSEEAAARRLAETKTRKLPALRAYLARLKEMLSAKDDPRVLYLRERRDALQLERELLIWHDRELDIMREVMREVLVGGKR